ncbi:Protein-S-isoprenylcysteine O-methyltransferase Ste14 [Arenibacter nanhaiticus]|uniref:Protein-S-isoprenylcysteine O-methyltransferase Ste14 n=1 Tax=Arenibacter nanhaiticus TaxID=558155 RepID=A0A1M6EGW1_9FLAO|nr:isoprenylcysteine carboxylmethyltransferase family protein [Arenibacter nanhaiticus]SHI84528.1 Protein-S-isoprenylcysteine O-methyltransferase Ste14 [Arenibacter nanhaiticus]
MKVKIPPVGVAVVFALLMYLLAMVLPVGDFEFFGRNYLILILVFMAVLIAFVSLFQFVKFKTSIDPLHPGKASRLITTGLYSYSRNPMYLALLLLLLAWGLWLGNAFNTLLAAGFVYFINAYQILPEEEALLKKFGKDYQKYCLAVRRWF